MQNHPWTGIGPDHWPLIASQYGWPPGKECHSLWLNAGAELGFPGLILLLLFYGTVICHCWRMQIALKNAASKEVDESEEQNDHWFADCGRMVTAALVGFAVSASFVSLDALEIPYYIALVGAGTLKVMSQALSPESASVSPEPITVWVPQPATPASSLS
jgi:O-antigen ligase